MGPFSPKTLDALWAPGSVGDVGDAMTFDLILRGHVRRNQPLDGSRFLLLSLISLSVVEPVALLWLILAVGGGP